MLRHLTRSSLALLVPVLALASVAFAHDSWISRGGFKNPAGEWCCGDNDCFAIPADSVHYGPAQTASSNQHPIVWGYHLAGAEFVPESEAMPSPDGQFWRCKRPDGSRRCFFAPIQSY
jgi:hypothetical protein